MSLPGPNQFIQATDKTMHYSTTFQVDVSMYTPLISLKCNWGSFVYLALRCLRDEPRLAGHEGAPSPNY